VPFCVRTQTSARTFTGPPASTPVVIASAAWRKRGPSSGIASLAWHIAVNVVTSIAATRTRLWALAAAALLDAVEEGTGRAFGGVERVAWFGGGCGGDHRDPNGLAVSIGAIEVADGIASVSWVWHRNVGNATRTILAVVEEFYA
jgi:hypothetical protein